MNLGKSGQANETAFNYHNAIFGHGASIRIVTIAKNFISGKFDT
jgi:hypothetical protein